MKKKHIALISILVTACAVVSIVLLAGNVHPVNAADRPASTRTAAVSARAGQTAGRAAVATAQAGRAADQKGVPSAGLEAIQAAVRKLRADIRDNRLRNERLSLENRSLRIDLRLRLEEARGSLSPEVLEQLKAKRQAIQRLVEQLADTQGDIRDIQKTFPALREQRDWAGLRAGCEQIIAVLKARHDILAQINALLKDMVKLVK